jgi:hypothetical protein
MEAIYFSFFAMKQRLYSDHWNMNAVMLYCSILPQAVEDMSRRRTQQEGIHACAQREPCINNYSTKVEGQQFPRPQLLTPDDDHIGRNM